MVLRYSLFFVFLLVFNFVKAEDLDTLLTGLAKAQNVAENAEPTGKSIAQSPEEPIAKNSEPVAKTASEAEPKITPKPFEPKPFEPKPFEPKPFEPKPFEPKPFIPQAVEMSHPTAIAAPTIAKSQAVAKPSVVVQPGEILTVSHEGLDTLHIDSSGNWLEKRIWYQKAEQAFEEIRKVVVKAADIRMKFVHEVSVIGKHIDDFYENVSFEKGQVDELLQAVLGGLTTEEKVRGGDLSSGERDIKLKIHENQQELQSIETNIKMIASLDEQVEKTMIKAFQEIDACRALENKAWNNFKEIGLELDDKKARTLYYEIENFYKNIQKKIEYLDNNLYEYLVQQLGSKITQTTSQIQSTTQSLKSKGMNLETLLVKDSTGDFVLLKERDAQQAKEAAAKEAAKAIAEKKATEKVAVSSWYQNAWCTLLEYVCPVFNKVSEWTMIVLCCIQTVLCKIQEFICRMLGY